MDKAIVEWLNSGVGRWAWWDAVMEAVVSDYLVPVLGSLVLLGSWFWGRGQGRFHHQLTAGAGIMAIALANLATLQLNNAYFRVRPFVDLDLELLFYQPTDSSFPSNTAALAFAIATAIFLSHRKLGVAMYGVALLYGFSRVYAGVHYSTDALAGAAIGVLAGLLAHGLARLLAPIWRVMVRMAQGLNLG